MRILSFIPAFLLVAASFVAAAPTGPTPTNTSCVSPPTGGNGGDTALRPVISIIANATAQIQPLSGQLIGLKGNSYTPDAVSGIVIQISAIVSTCVNQLQAAAKVDLTGYDLTDLCATIYGLLALILMVLNTLVTIVTSLGADAVGTILTVVTNLLYSVTNLLGCLKVFADASLHGVLGPVISVVCAVVDVFFSIVAAINVATVVH